ncbi:MAG: methyltransferase domain-containing protein [Haliangium ochraceum]
MPERNATDFLNLRLPLYAYTAPLWQGSSVLEVGCGDGGSAEYLSAAGAASVVAIDFDVARVDRARARHARPRIDFRTAVDLRQVAALPERFDVILVPEGQQLLASPDAIAGLRGLLAAGGHLVVAVPAADRKNRTPVAGVGYYDLADALAARFPVVRMLGQTPFLGFGLVEFDGSADALRVDVSLLHGGSEQPSHYVAIAGAAAPPALGYALVQVPFAPVESMILGAATAPEITPMVAAIDPAPVPTPVSGAADIRAEMAERRLDEAERRARARLDDADNRLMELRRKLDEALLQAESSVRVARVQGEEIEELRGRLRRVSEDRAASDADMSNLRRALAQADESVLTLTRRTAEEMAVVAQKMVTGLGSGAGSGQQNAEAEARAKRAEEASARDRAEVASLTERVRAADEQLRTLKQKAASVGERDDRIARLEADKQDLAWRVAELEEKLRHAEADRASGRSTSDEITMARAARDRAIEEFHRVAAAHANEVNQLQSSVAEQAALVAELEDSVRTAEARAAAADKEATTLRRNAKELEEADRSRRGRLAELEGKLLRLERERAMAAESPGAGTPAGDADALAELRQRLASAEQRALVAEQQVVAAEERAALAAAKSSAAASPRNGHHVGSLSPAEIQAAVTEIEERLRDEMRSLAAIEETLARAREEAARAVHAADPTARADLERALAAKDSQLVEGRLELARLRRDAEARQTQLESEIGDLRGRLGSNGAGGFSDDQGKGEGAQLILMHSTLANIRRRSARLRDELEGFRRRLDTLPPGALSSMLEEIGEDLAEFAK